MHQSRVHAQKYMQVVEVELTMLQRHTYRAILEKNFDHLLKGAKKSALPSLMNVMMELRKCCNHPYLIKGIEEAQIAAGTREVPTHPNQWKPSMAVIPHSTFPGCGVPPTAVVLHGTFPGCGSLMSRSSYSSTPFVRRLELWPTHRWIQIPAHLYRASFMS